MHSSTRATIVRLAIAVVLACQILGAFAAGPALARPDLDATAVGGERRDLIGGHFEVRGPVLAGRPFDLIFSISPTMEMPGTTISLLLPEGVRAISGSTAWQGDVAARETVEHKVTLLLPAGGEYDVRAVVKRAEEADPLRVYHAFLDPTSPRGLKEEPTPREHSAKRQVSFVPESRDGGAMARANALAPEFYADFQVTVAGRLWFITDDGNNHPVRYHSAQLWEVSQSGQRLLLQSCTTSEDGRFYFSPQISSARFAVVDVLCETEASVARAATGETYYAEFGPFLIAPGYYYELGNGYLHWDYDEWEASDIVLSANVSATPRPPAVWVRPRITIQWPYSGKPQTDGTTIRLPAQSSTWWDKVGVSHLYAHTLQHSIFGYLPTPCDGLDHDIDRETTPQTAFTEGFAEFFAALVAGADRISAVTCGNLQNIESNHWELGHDCLANNSGAIVEGAIASILWDIYDGTGPAEGDPDRDYISNHPDQIIGVIRNYKPLDADSFWAALADAGHALSSINLIYYDHGIDKDTAPLVANPSPADGASALPGVITLSWTGSDAEGDGLMYDVYLGSSSTPPLVAWNRTVPSYSTGSALGAGKYYWRVVARDQIGKTTAGPLWQFTVCEEGVAVPAGWSLISITVVPSDMNPGAVLASLGDQYVGAYAYMASDTADPWKQYIPGAGSGNDLASIDPSMGVWIHATSPATLCLADATASSTPVPLKAGWNLVGYPSQTARPVPEALASIAGKYDVIYGYDPGTASDPWRRFSTAMPAALNQLTLLEPYKGYWIHVTEDCTWTLP